MSTRNLFLLTIVTVALSVLSGCTTTVTFRPRTGPRYHHTDSMPGGRYNQVYTPGTNQGPTVYRHYYNPTRPATP